MDAQHARARRSLGAVDLRACDDPLAGSRFPREAVRDGALGWQIGRELAKVIDAAKPVEVNPEVAKGVVFALSTRGKR